MGRYYPLMVDLTGRRCLVVGGGVVAERKVRALLEAGGEVLVVSPALTPGLEALKREGRIVHLARPYQPGDLAGSFLVFGATDDHRVNRRLADEAKAAGVLANMGDSPTSGTFLAPAVLTRGDLVIAISTGGGSPALAKKLRQRLEQTIGPEYEAYLTALRLLRERARRAIADPRARQAVFRRAVESDLFERAARGDAAGVAACIEGLLQAAPRAAAET